MNNLPTDGKLRDSYKGVPVFQVSDLDYKRSNGKKNKYSRWSSFFEEDSESIGAVKNYSLRNPNSHVILQNSDTGEMKLLRRRYNDMRLKHNRNVKSFAEFVSEATALPNLPTTPIPVSSQAQPPAESGGAQIIPYHPSLFPSGRGVPVEGWNGYDQDGNDVYGIQYPDGTIVVQMGNYYLVVPPWPDQPYYLQMGETGQLEIPDEQEETIPSFNYPIDPGDEEIGGGWYLNPGNYDDGTLGWDVDGDGNYEWIVTPGGEYYYVG